MSAAGVVVRASGGACCHVVKVWHVKDKVAVTQSFQGLK